MCNQNKNTIDNELKYDKWLHAPLNEDVFILFLWFIVASATFWSHTWGMGGGFHVGGTWKSYSLLQMFEYTPFEQ